MGSSFSSKNKKNKDELITKIQKVINSLKEKINNNNVALSGISKKNGLIEERISNLKNANELELQDLKHNLAVNENRITEMLDNLKSVEEKCSELELNFFELNSFVHTERQERMKSEEEIYEKIQYMNKKTEKKMEDIFQQLMKLSVNVDNKLNGEKKEREENFIGMKKEITSEYKKVIEDVFKVNNNDLEDSVQAVLEDEGNNAWLPDNIERKLIRNSVVVVYDLLKKSRN
jgi:hypothetical protein